MHVDLKSAPTIQDMSANIARLAALGLEVHITEMEVRVPADAKGNASPTDLAAQATIYKNAISACRANSNCNGVRDLGCVRRICRPYELSWVRRRPPSRLPI